MIKIVNAHKTLYNSVQAVEGGAIRVVCLGLCLTIKVRHLMGMSLQPAFEQLHLISYM